MKICSALVLFLTKWGYCILDNDKVNWNFVFQTLWLYVIFQSTDKVISFYYDLSSVLSVLKISLYSETRRLGTKHDEASISVRKSPRKDEKRDIKWIFLMEDRKFVVKLRKNYLFFFKETILFFLIFLGSWFAGKNQQHDSYSAAKQKVVKNGWSKFILLEDST